VKAKQANKNERMAGPNNNILLDPPSLVGLLAAALHPTDREQSSNLTTTKIPGFSSFCKCSE
jgi:hypothetical protein